MTVIARRVLASALGEMTVTLDAPVADGLDWRCGFRIEGPRLSAEAHAMGVDGFQALDLAMRLIGAALRSGEEFRAGPISWLDRDEPGFPLPQGCEELGWRR